MPLKTRKENLRERLSEFSGYDAQKRQARSTKHANVVFTATQNGILVTINPERFSALVSSSINTTGTSGDGE
jgi:hypothetical protein